MSTRSQQGHLPSSSYRRLQGSARRIFVVMAAYNEADKLREVVQSVAQLGHRIIIVNDGSTDNTRAVAEELPVTVVNHPLNLGQGAALQTGVTLALRMGATHIVHLDSDGQHDCNGISHFLLPLLKGEADVALGSRFLRKEDRSKVPFMRRLVLMGGVIVNGLTVGVWLSDAHNGFRAFTREAAEKIHFKENRFAHASEVLSEIRGNALRFVEVPTTITYSHRSLAKGQSNWNAVNVLIDLLSRRFFQ